MNSLLFTVTISFFGELGSFFSFAKKAFVDFGINDAVDILILTLIFALAFRFFKNRKAGALIIGIVVCLVVLILATIFDLAGVRYIFSGLFKIGALALVIIFQPEIRDFLEKLGSGSIKSISGLADKGNKKQLHYNVVDNICKAVQILSLESTGALIVMERAIKLDEIIGTGTPLNADVSDSLLRNIFYNRAPLHDGAVVIVDGRIAAASCILPLPKRIEVDSELGTRHRAAIGLGEISDAIVIVVSEETGVISIAREGQLTRHFTPESLRKYLRREFIHDSTNEDENN